MSEVVEPGVEKMKSQNGEQPHGAYLRFPVGKYSLSLLAGTRMSTAEYAYFTGSQLICDIDI
jgi:hypothetical protein